MFRDSYDIYIWVINILCTFHVFISGYATQCWNNKIKMKYFLEVNCLGETNRKDFYDGTGCFFSFPEWTVN